MKNNFHESIPFDDKRNALEREKENLAQIIAKLNDIQERSEALDPEDRELSTIIIGLYEKVDSLILEDKDKSAKMPETDEEWEAWIAREERIGKIRETVFSLESEQADLQSKMEAIYRDFEDLERKNL